jgi:type III secretion protein T
MIDALPLQLLIDKLFPFLAAWMVFGSRFLGFALVFPLFSWVNLSPIVRAAFAAAMAAPLAIYELTSPSFTITIGAGELTALVSKELFVGLLLGLLAGLPYWAAQNCGEVIDTYRGSSAGTLFDPSLTSETSVLGTALILIALALLVWSGGLIDMLAQIYQSFQVWPAFSLFPLLERSAAATAGAMVGKQLLIAVGMAGAIVMSLFAVDLALALMGRTTRQVQVFDISLVLKNLALVLLLPVIGAALITLIGREVATGRLNIDMLPVLIRAAAP